MNPSEIASTVITFLSPYLLKSGEEIAKKAGEAVWKKVEEIHQAIKTRFNEEKDGYPREVLKNFEKNPDKRKEALKEVLAEIIEKDKDFEGTLSKLLEEAKGHAILAGPEFVTNVFGGEVGEIFNINYLKELTINKGPKKK